MEKLIVTATINGGITPRSKNPAVPHIPEEIAEAVCVGVGQGMAMLIERVKNNEIGVHLINYIFECTSFFHCQLHFSII